jgi:hypothetical protein
LRHFDEKSNLEMLRLSVLKARSGLSDAGGRRIFVLLCLLLAGCNSQMAGGKPDIQFTRVPPAGEGGSDKLDIVEGSVRGAKPGQRVVLYAKAEGVWWVQPLDSRPFTAIGSDGTWKSATHLGSQYAALVVDPGFQPAATIKALPPEGGAVEAVAAVSVGEALVTVDQTLNFSGYEWNIRHITSDRNGAISFYDAQNAWTDSEGNLHLRISRQGDRWMCSQVILKSHLGYGTYLFSVRDTSHLEPGATLAILTHDDLPAEHHREMDIELGQWGDPKNKNADYVVQPYNFPENKVIFEAPSGRLTHSLHWEAGKATFQTFRDSGHGSRPSVVETNEFTTGIPSPGGQNVILDFCDFKYSKVPLKDGAEVVIEKFRYLP